MREAIMKCLADLATALDDFEQTTHATSPYVDLDDVCEFLVECWKNPTAYNVSELAQRIRHFKEMSQL